MLDENQVNDFKTLTCYLPDVFFIIGYSGKFNNYDDDQKMSEREDNELTLRLGLKTTTTGNQKDRRRWGIGDGCWD